MVNFLLERTAPLSPPEAWRRLTDWPRHGEVVPLTRITVTTPPPTGEGTRFTARTGTVPLGFDNEDIIVRRLGRTSVEFRRLLERGIVAAGPRD